MKVTGGETGINLYEGYLRLLKKEKSGAEKKSLAFLPLIGVGVILLGVGASIFMENMAKAAQLTSLAQEAEAMQPQYERAQAVSDTYQTVDTAYQNLAASHFVYDLYPTLTRELIEVAQACAGEIFQITNYSYDETTGALILNANAESVNDVPDFITRLRDTGKFSSVQYTGYTSDTTGQYYCTVGCMLDTSVLEGLGEVFSTIGETEGAAASAEGTPAGDGGESTESGEAGLDELANMA